MPSVQGYREQGMAALLEPARGVFMITPSDSADLAHVTRRIVVTGSAGNVAVTMVDGGTATVAVLAGEALDWAVVRVLSSGTTATGLRGEY